MKTENALGTGYRASAEAQNGPSELVRAVNERASNRRNVVAGIAGDESFDGAEIGIGWTAGPLGEAYTPRTRARLDWWGIGKGAALGTLLGSAVVGVVAMPVVAAMVGLAVASVLTLGAMVVGGLCADVGRRMGVVSSGQ